ncbi:arsenate reductase (glutaredoxin) [Ectothiorhodospiraceae bacterium 2226]|nr:arsenate reductase (glutaredoxin) [Ectothiorhodospiraceae bacterium 2226]
MVVTIFHNPRCSKSRATLELLQAKGITPRAVEYLKAPPSPAQLEEILRKLGMEDPRQLMRRQEPEYRQLSLDDPTLDRQALLAAMAAHPRLIERPIVIAGERAALGRPPENVLEIL